MVPFEQSQHSSLPSSSLGWIMLGRCLVCLYAVIHSCRVIPSTGQHARPKCCCCSAAVLLV